VFLFRLSCAADHATDDLETLSSREKSDYLERVENRKEKLMGPLRCIIRPFNFIIEKEPSLDPLAIEHVREDFAALDQVRFQKLFEKV
jgi:hypothetical protein